MVECANSPENYTTLKLIIEAIMENPEILRFFPDYLKTNKCVYK